METIFGDRIPAPMDIEEILNIEDEEMSIPPVLDNSSMKIDLIFMVLSKLLNKDGGVREMKNASGSAPVDSHLSLKNGIQEIA
ncbi:hypothetical protein LXL04_033002 [Taraxacum kok-saghyz]